MGEIGRDLADLAGQAIGRYHQYPDGLVLFIGTMFTPVDDRGAPGSGFTHKVGDVVSISSPELGTLVNEVVHCDQAEPWTFGTGALMANLARRGLLHAEASRSAPRASPQGAPPSEAERIGVTPFEPGFAGGSEGGSSPLRWPTP